MKVGSRRWKERVAEAVILLQPLLVHLKVHHQMDKDLAEWWIAMQHTMASKALGSSELKEELLTKIDTLLDQEEFYK